MPWVLRPVSRAPGGTTLDLKRDELATDFTCLGNHTISNSDNFSPRRQFIFSATIDKRQDEAQHLLPGQRVAEALRYRYDTAKTRPIAKNRVLTLVSP